MIFLNFRSFGVKYQEKFGNIRMNFITFVISDIYVKNTNIYAGGAGGGIYAHTRGDTQ